MVYELQVVIVKKELGLEKAKKIAHDIIKRDDIMMRETKDSYRFRNILKTKFKLDSFKTKKVNENISLVFGERI